MINTTSKLSATVTALLALTASTFADMKVNDSLSFSGYLTGTISNTVTDSVQDSFFDIDSFKLSAMAKSDKLSGVVSLHSFDSKDPVLLDAYATYTTAGGTAVTAGNFLSYLGFEAFDFPNMLQISYANTLGAFIPAYHSGVKFDYSSEGVSGGFAVLDSVYGPSYYKGDGTLNNGAGYEGYLKFTQGNSALFMAVAYDEGVAGGDNTRTTYDIWGQTKAGNTTLAAEYCYSSYDAGAKTANGYFWLLLAMQPLSDTWSVTAHLSGGEDENLAISTSTPTFTKATLSPSVTITKNLGVLFEYSYIKYKNFSADKAHYFAAQAVFKF